MLTCFSFLPFLDSRDHLCCADILEPAGGLYCRVVVSSFQIDPRSTNGSTVNDIPSSPLNPNIAFAPATTQTTREESLSIIPFLLCGRILSIQPNRILRLSCLLYEQAGTQATWTIWIRPKWFYTICRLLPPFERPAYVSHIDEHASKELEDYRGLLVLVNKDSRVVVTVLGSKEISVQEEPTIWEGSHKKDHQSPQSKRSTMNILFSSPHVCDTTRSPGLNHKTCCHRKPYHHSHNH
ncbi:hypothetical protein EV421DRAFT_1806715 [Armillaria borealis]|uniref:Uncharacterized protein n=1 Tax=Armillaria borealis TaxID=47425 RepID=A0AA39JIP6_9AGAR|nr:hypothetical protein EV421DRAFT_1806715 [Armillaria borealis]